MKRVLFFIAFMLLLGRVHAQAPDLKPTFALIESALTELEVDPKESRGEKEGQWSLSLDTFSIWIDAWYIEGEDQAYFQVMTPVLELPEKAPEKLFRKLLELNDEMYQVGFSIYEGWIWLKEIREVENLDKQEALNMIMRVGNYATGYIEDIKKLIK